MSLKKLHAGEGYTYLTRQVASGDHRRKNGELMVDYYTADGLPSGTWWGKGAEQLGVSGEVTEDQMRAAYGEFLHPDADTRLKELIQDGVRPKEALNRVRLGAKAYDFNRDIPFMVQRKQAIEQFTLAHRRVPNDEEREVLELKIAREMLPEELIGSQKAARGLVAEAKRKARYAVSGYDLVFTPVKSVSVLWGTGNESTRKAIMAAHMQAVDETLQWIEDNAIYTRAGRNGVRKLDCAGMAVAKFVHWDNRAGDPNLHTHCAVLNRVFSEGKYRTIDGTILYRSAVAASEHYNARIKDLVQEKLQVSFDQVTKTRGARPVWEVRGVPKELIDGFSRRPEVVARARELLEEYRKTYHREPLKSAQWAIMEQANLQTRGAKGDIVPLAQLVEQWKKRAGDISEDFDLDDVLSAVEDNAGNLPPMWDPGEAESVVDTAVDTVSSASSTWTQMSLEAEIYRQLAHYRFATYEEKREVVSQLLTNAVEGRCISIDQRRFLAAGPRRKDGESVFYSHGSRTLTTTEVLTAEERLSRAAQQWVVNMHTEKQLESAEDALEEAEGFRLSTGQEEMVRHLLFSPSRVAVASGAAGTGKTTAMKVFADAWKSTGNRVVALAPSAKAAEVLGDSLGVSAQTLAYARHVRLADGAGNPLSEGDVVIIDEAGMASTRDLDAVVAAAAEVGAVVRMIGDPQQLAAVETGGMFDELVTETNAPLLQEVRRFTDDEEAEVSLRLRAGDTGVVDWYLGHDRVRMGIAEELPAQVFADWSAALDEGKSAVMIAGDNQTVATLNEMAQEKFIEDGRVDPAAGRVNIYGGQYAAVGDVVVTRRNDSRLRYGDRRSRRVTNGDMWTVESVHSDGSVSVRHIDSGQTVELPCDYVADNVELGYASTVHRSQGITVDRAFIMPSDRTDRQGFYVGMTRGRELNRCYVADDVLPDPDTHAEQLQPPSAREVIESIIRRDGRAITAHEALRRARDEVDLGELIDAYKELRWQVAREVIESLCPPQVWEELAEDEQTPRLAATISLLDARGVDVETVLPAACVRAKSRWDAEVAAANVDDEQQPGSLAFYVRMALEDDFGAGREESVLWTAGLTGLPRFRRGVMDEQAYRLAGEVGERIARELTAAGDRAVAQTEPEGVAALAGADPGREVDPEAHLAWEQAVRALAGGAAARELDPDDDLTEADQRFSELVAAAGSAAKESVAERDKARAAEEIDRLIRAVGTEVRAAEEEQAVWSRRAETAESVHPRQDRVLAERELARQAARLDTQRAELAVSLRQAIAAEQQARRQVEAAQRSGLLGRRGRVQTAERAHDEAQAVLDEVRGRHQAAGEAITALVADHEIDDTQWSRLVAVAGNEAEWSARVAAARQADAVEAAGVAAHAERAGQRAAVLRGRLRQLHTVAQGRAPISDERRGELMAKMRQELAERKAAREARSASGRHSDGTRTTGRSGDDLMRRAGMVDPHHFKKQLDHMGQTRNEPGGETAREASQREAERSTGQA